MSAPKGADITDAVTRSALVQLFKQFVLAQNPKSWVEDSVRIRN